MKRRLNAVIVVLLALLAGLWVSNAQVTQQAVTPTLLAAFNATAQAANVPSTLVFTTSLAGTYRPICYVEVTQAATTSSTMPNCVVSWTTSDSASAQSANITSTSAANTVGTNSATVATATPNAVIQAGRGVNINVSTAGYASSGATPMQYAVHFKLETLGQ